MLPIFRHFYATNISKAFILNAIAVAAITTIAIELRRALDNEKGLFYTFVNPLFTGSNINENQKTIVLITTSFIGAIIVYHLLYLMFGYGGGMLINNKNYKYF
jgi:hypothetical protein